MRRYFMIFLVVALGWLLSRLFTSARAVAARRPRGVPPPTPGNEMVRDRVCNTFLPRSSALTSRLGGEEHFFCSEQCRRRFLERAS